MFGYQGWTYGVDLEGSDHGDWCEGPPRLLWLERPIVQQSCRDNREVDFVEARRCRFERRLIAQVDEVRDDLLAQCKGGRAGPYDDLTIARIRDEFGHERRSKSTGCPDHQRSHNLSLVIGWPNAANRRGLAKNSDPKQHTDRPTAGIG